MADIYNGHRLPSIVDFVNDPITTNTNSPAIAIDKFFASVGPRIIRQRDNCLPYGIVVIFWNCR